MTVNYTTIGIVNVNDEGTTVSQMDREALKRILELERQVKELTEQKNSLERRAVEAERLLARQKILGSAA